MKSILSVFGVDKLDASQLSLDSLLKNNMIDGYAFEYNHNEERLNFHHKSMYLHGVLMGLDSLVAHKKFNLTMLITTNMGVNTPCGNRDELLETINVLPMFLVNCFCCFRWDWLNSNPSLYQNVIEEKTIDDDHDFIERRKILCAILCGYSVEFSHKSLVDACINDLNSAILEIINR